MASEVSIAVASVVEEVIKQHGARLSDTNLASRRAEEAAIRRNEAAAWLRKTVGVVVAKDLPEEPSEEEFRVGLRNGIILCNALNKVQPGAIPKVVEVPVDSIVIPDGAPLSAYQYFENVRNFLVSLQDMGLPTFEASDLERGGKAYRVVDSILALKSSTECKQAGKNGSWRFGGMPKPFSSGKHFIRKGFDPFMNSLSRTPSLPEKQLHDLSLEHSSTGDYLIQSTEMKSSHSLNLLVRTALSNKKPEEIPLLVESMLNKVMQEFEHRIANQTELVKSSWRDMSSVNTSTTSPELSSLSTDQKDLPTWDKCDSHADVFTSPLETKIEAQENAANAPKNEEPNMKDDENELKNMLIIQKEKEAEMQALKERLLLMEKQLKITEAFLIQQQHKTKAMEQDEVEKCEENISKEMEVEGTKQQTLQEKLIKQQLIFSRQQQEIQELKCALSLAKTGMEQMKSQYTKDFSNLGIQLCALASAASRYHKVLDENRKLYNQIQDLKGNIRVYCRVRPFLPGQMSCTSSVGRIDDQNIKIATPSKNGKDLHRNFTFNKVFGPSATQEEIFSDTQPLIRSILDGYKVCIFAYGQTGSGKTHTMSGPKELNDKTIGVNYRALNDLFYLSQQRSDTFSYEIAVQMLEIYNEQVRDLLSDDLNKRLEIRNSSNIGISVPDASLIPVRSTAEVIEIMNLGQKNRAVGCTAMNDRSSRSHSCLTIHVQGRELTSESILRGCMHLVDLAGSERVDKSEVKGDRLKEAQHINKSLSALGDVIASLAQKNVHVPYRNSKLTQLLQDSLGGQAKTLMFVHISPEAHALGETLSTLKFAERVATVELGAAKTNKDSGEVKDLKEQIAALKDELSRRGEGDPLRTAMSSPNICIDETNYPASSKQPMEEVRSNLTRPKKSSYEAKEVPISMDSTWPNNTTTIDIQMEDDKDIGTGMWVDKVIVNNNEENDNNLRYSDESEFMQKYLNDMEVHHEKHRNQFDFEFEDSENATSQSSELEPLSQLNVSKIPSVVNGMSKIKRPQVKGTKSIEGRNSSHRHIPTPSRKVQNGPTQTPNRTGRQPVQRENSPVSRVVEKKR